MHGTRDSSIWKNLALAFGDGLAFGAGVNFSKRAAGRITAPRADLRSLGERLNELENRIDRSRQQSTPADPSRKIVEAVVSAVDERLHEQSEEFEQRLSAALAAIRGEIAEQRAADREQADRREQILRGQVSDLHRQFAESIARLVDEQVSASIEQRLAPLEEKLEALSNARLEAEVTQRIEPMQSEVADLRQRVGENSQEMLDMVLAMGRLCLETAERISGGPLEQHPGQEPVTPPAVSAEGVAAEEAGRPSPKPVWRIPAVSSFFVATAGLLLLHYL